MTKLMKDVFGSGEFSSYHEIVCKTGEEDICFLEDSEKAEAVARALNNYDTLTEQNKQLVENFQVLIHEMKQNLTRGSYAVDTESGSSMVISIPAVNGEISKITRALIDDDYMNSILAKHKEQI